MSQSWWDDRAPNDVRVLTFADNRGTLRDALLARKILKLDLGEYDVVLSSGPAAKFYQTRDDQTRYHYLHHPPLPAVRFENRVHQLVKKLDDIETWMIGSSPGTAG